MLRLSWEHVRAFRARRQSLDGRVPRRHLLRVVRELCGLHAQLLSSAELTLWGRVEGLARGDVERALWTERTLVKTWAMRGTLHLFAVKDLPLWHGALASYDHYLRPSWLRYFGVAPGQMEQLQAAIAEALSGQLLTRQELAREVSRRTGDEALGAKILQSWGSLLKPAAYSGQLCFAPGTPPRVRFTNPHTWVGERRPVEAERAHARVLRRFLAAHGPASPADYARWLAVPVKQARAQLDGQDDLAEVEVEGARLFALRADLSDLEHGGPVRSVRLLPAFDQLVVGCSLHAAHFMARPLRERVYRPQGWLSPVLLAGGRIDAVWRAEKKGRALSIVLSPFVRPSPAVRTGVEEEAERLASFLGLTPRVRWS